MLPKITFTAQNEESSILIQKQIVGNKNSSVSDLIQKLQNSDWVKKGFEYMPSELHKEISPCPICQEKTISEDLIQQLKTYFDESSEDGINSVKASSDRYSEALRHYLPKHLLKQTLSLKFTKKILKLSIIF